MSSPSNGGPNKRMTRSRAKEAPEWKPVEMDNATIRELKKVRAEKQRARAFSKERNADIHAHTSNVLANTQRRLQGMSQELAQCRLNNKILDERLQLLESYYNTKNKTPTPTPYVSKEIKVRQSVDPKGSFIRRGKQTPVYGRITS